MTRVNSENEHSVSMNFRGEAMSYIQDVALRERPMDFQNVDDYEPEFFFDILCIQAGPDGLLGRIFRHSELEAAARFFDAYSKMEKFLHSDRHHLPSQAVVDEVKISARNLLDMMRA